jgi:hypothetical protein
VGVGSAGEKGTGLVGSFDFWFFSLKKKKKKSEKVDKVELIDQSYNVDGVPIQYKNPKIPIMGQFHDI